MASFIDLSKTLLAVESLIILSFDRVQEIISFFAKQGVERTPAGVRQSVEEKSKNTSFIFKVNYR